MREIQSVLKLPRKQSVCVLSGLQRKKIALFRKNSLSENHTNLANRAAETKRQFKFPPGLTTDAHDVLAHRSLKQTHSKSLKANIQDGFSSKPEWWFCSCNMNCNFQRKKALIHAPKFQIRKHYLTSDLGSWISNPDVKEANPKTLLHLSQMKLPFSLLFPFNLQQYLLWIDEQLTT